MKVVVSHPTGNTFVRALIEVLYREGRLSSYYTTFSWDSKKWINNILPANIKRELSRRSYEIPHSLIKTKPLLELFRLLSGRINRPSLNGGASLNAVYQDLDKVTAKSIVKEDLTHIHCYEDGAKETFLVAKNKGVHCSYELPIAYWRTLHQLLSEQSAKHPDWAPTLVYGNDTEEKLVRKDRELELADTIVVPSKFVKDSLPKTVEKFQHKVIVSPFGTPVLAEEFEKIEKPSSSPIRFLFAGSMGQRKGLADLFEAFNKLKRKDVSLIVLGSPMMPMDFYRKAYPDFIYEPPRPHQSVLKLMRTCHVLALPSIVEGRALVQQEAMSQGMALMVTRNAGGEDLVLSGETGYLVPHSSPLALIEVINKFADHPKQTIEMGIAAKRHVQNYSWEEYGRRIVSSLETKI